MQKWYLVVIGLLLALATQAQITPAAANYEKSFWQNIERLKTLDFATARGAYTNSLSQAETNLKQIKKYAPNYDVAKHQAAYDQYLAVANQGQADIAQQRAITSLDEKIKAFENNPNPSVYDAELEIKAIDQKIATLKADFPSANISSQTARLDVMRSKVADMRAKKNAEQSHASSEKEAVSPRVSGGKSPSDPSANGGTTPTRAGKPGGPATTAVDGKVPDEGVTGPLHQAHMGKIMFTRDYLGREETTEGSFITTTTALDYLSLRVYVAKSQVNVALEKFPAISPEDIHDHNYYQFIWYLDGNKVLEGDVIKQYFDDREEDKNTTFPFEIFSKKSGGFYTYQDWDKLVLKVGDLMTKGTHTLKLELYQHVELQGGAVVGPLATGEIKMNFATDLINPADPRVCLPKAVKVDADLQAKMLTAFKGQGWDETAGKAIILGDWETVRNEYTSVIKGRKIYGAVSSTLNGKCAFQEFTFFQDYNGSSYAGPLSISGVGDKSEIHCGCFK